MSSKSRIRLTCPNISNAGKDLPIIQSLTLIYISPLRDPPHLHKTYTYTVCKLPLSALVTSSFRDDNPTVVARTTKSVNDFLLLPDSIHITLDEPSFHTLGLAASSSRRARGSSTRRVEIPLKDDALVKRAAFCLSEGRIGAADVVLSGGSASVRLPDGFKGGLRRIVAETERFSVVAARIGLFDVAERIRNGDYDAVLKMVDEVQTISSRKFRGIVPEASETGRKVAGKVKVAVQKYVGVCSAEIVRESLECAVRFVAEGGVGKGEDGGYVAVLARGFENVTEGAADRANLFLIGEWGCRALHMADRFM